MITKTGCRFRLTMMLKKTPKGLIGEPMKKKTGAGNGPPHLARPAKRPPPKPPRLLAAHEANAAVRPPRTELAKAPGRIEEVQAPADPGFLPDNPKPRRLERRLHRSVALLQP